MGHDLRMLERVLIELSVGVEVTDHDALVAAALARYDTDRPANTPPDHVEEFKELIRTNPAFAIHQLRDAEDAVRSIPGVRYVGHHGSDRLLEQGEPFPWAQQPTPT